MPAVVSDAAQLELDLHQAFLAHEDAERFLRFCRDAVVRSCMAEGYLLEPFQRHEGLTDDWAATSWFTRVRAANEAARAGADALLGIVVRTEWQGRLAVWLEAGSEQAIEQAALSEPTQMLGTLGIVQGSRTRDWQSAAFGASQLRLLLRTPHRDVHALYPVQDLLVESTLRWMRPACKQLLATTQP